MIGAKEYKIKNEENDVFYNFKTSGCVWFRSLLAVEMNIVESSTKESEK